MTMSERFEEERLLKPKTTNENRAKHLFNALGSAGASNTDLARLLVAFDFAMSLLGWDVKLTDIVTGYQASIDAKYHDDYKAVATIEELDQRLLKRRSFGKTENQQQSLL